MIFLMIYHGLLCMYFLQELLSPPWKLHDICTMLVHHVHHRQSSRVRKRVHCGLWHHGPDINLSCHGTGHGCHGSSYVSFTLQFVLVEVQKPNIVILCSAASRVVRQSAWWKRGFPNIGSSRFNHVLWLMTIYDAISLPLHS